MKTQISSYRKSKVSFADRAAEIAKILKVRGPLSRRQIALELGVESNSVTAAVQCLISEGKAVELRQTVYDEETDRNQALITLAESNTKPAKIKLTPKMKIKKLEDQLALSQKRERESEARISKLTGFMRFLLAQQPEFLSLVREFNQKGTN